MSYPPHPPQSIPPPASSPPSAHRRGEVLVLVVHLQVDGEDALERPLHLVAVGEGVVAEDEVEAGAQVRLLRHDVLERRDRVAVLAELHERDADVLHQARPAGDTRHVGARLIGGRAGTPEGGRAGTPEGGRAGTTDWRAGGDDPLGGGQGRLIGRQAGTSDWTIVTGASLDDSDRCLIGRQALLPHWLVFDRLIVRYLHRPTFNT